MGNRWGDNGNSVRLYFGGVSKITTDGDCSQEMKRHLLLGRKVMSTLGSILKSRDITLPTEFHLVKAMVCPVVMYGCESWMWRKLSTKKLILLNCGVGEDSWASLGLQGDPASPSWRRSVLGVHWKDWCWSCNSNTLATSCESWLIEKDPDAGRDWGQEEKGMVEDEMAGWNHQFDGHEFE